MKRDIQAHLLDGVPPASEEDFDPELLLGTRRSTRLQKTPAPKPVGRGRGRGRARGDKEASSEKKRGRGRGRGRGRTAYTYENDYTSSENDISSKLEDDVR